MAIDNAELTRELGVLFGGLKEINTYRGTTLVSRLATIRTEYATDQYGNLTGLTDAAGSAKASLDGITGYLSGRVADTIISFVNADRGTDFSEIDPALVEWNRQLRNAAQTFNDCPATATKANVGSPTADYTFVTTTKTGLGKASDFCLPDVYLVTVAQDADRGGTRWAESLAVLGRTADLQATDATYGGATTGAGIDTTVTVIDPDVTGGLVTDGTFAGYESNAFTAWTRVGVTDQADSFRAALDYRNGAAGFSLALVSDGTTIPRVKQTVTPTAATMYAVYFAVRAVNLALTTARVQVSLRRTDTNAVVTDAFGTSCTVQSSQLTTIGVNTWAVFSAVFCAPEYIPATGLYLDIQLNNGTIDTASTVATSAYVDHVSVIELSPLYDSGPALAVFSGIVNPLLTDQWTVTVALSSGVVSDYIIRWLDRTIGLSGRTYVLPTLAGGTETLPDSNIV